MQLRNTTRWALALELGLAACITNLSWARAQSLSEYQVKAAFLYNFAKFVDWPQDSTGEPFAVCVLGDDPFRGTLDGVVKDKMIDGRPVFVRRVPTAEAARGCQILFISSSERGAFSSIFDALNGVAVLTVGETRGFAEAGGVINFVVEDERVRLEVNVEAAERARLRISSRLLSLARIVKDSRRGVQLK